MESNHDKEQNQMGYTGRGKGPQGVDKAPGEESSSGPDQFVQQTQKGKDQVDGDLDQGSDRPLDRQDI